MSQLTIAYTPEYLEWTGSHASPERARLAVELIRSWAGDVTELVPTLDWPALSAQLRTVHAEAYIARVQAGLEVGTCHGSRRQGEIAAIMAQGTVDLVHRLEDDGWMPRIYFNPQGAKHHAAFDHSSGFCVFNDHAWAAARFAAAGRRVAYIDWDVHHGDGVEALTRDDPSILTASIHGPGFPGTGNAHEPARHVYNHLLRPGDGDAELGAAIDDILTVLEGFAPDVVLLACGADGLAGDPLGSLRYTIDGIAAQAAKLGDFAASRGLPMLVGGAGGYQPLTETPAAWSATIRALDAAYDRARIPV